MKNLLFLLTAALTLTLFSCGKDDPQGDPQGDPQDPVEEIPLIQGNWNLASISYAGNETVSSEGTEDAVTFFVGEGRDLDLVLSFNADDTYASAGSYVMDVTSTINGFSQTLEESFTDFLGSGVYEFTDPEIKFTSDIREVETSMTVLTENNLDFKVLISTSSTEFGVSRVKHLNYTLSLTK